MHGKPLNWPEPLRLCNLHIFSVYAAVLVSGCVHFLLGSKAHAETGQVSVGEGEEDHEDDVQGVVAKQHGEVVTRLHVAQHEEGDEDDPQAHHDRKPHAVFTRLERERTTSTTGTDFHSQHFNTSGSFPTDLDEHVQITEAL